MAVASFTVSATHNAAIGADVARAYLSFSLEPGQPMVWWNFGATYDATIREPLILGVPRVFTGTQAQAAVSFKVDTLSAIVGASEDA